MQSMPQSHAFSFPFCNSPICLCAFFNSRRLHTRALLPPYRRSASSSVRPGHRRRFFLLLGRSLRRRLPAVGRSPFGSASTSRGSPVGSASASSPRAYASPAAPPSAADGGGGFSRTAGGGGGLGGSGVGDGGRLRRGGAGGDPCSATEVADSSADRARRRRWAAGSGRIRVDLLGGDGDYASGNGGGDWIWRPSTSPGVGRRRHTFQLLRPLLRAPVSAGFGRPEAGDGAQRWPPPGAKITPPGAAAEELRVKGIRFFECPQGHGAIVRPEKVKVGDFPERDPFV